MGNACAGKKQLQVINVGAQKRPNSAMNEICEDQPALKDQLEVRDTSLVGNPPMTLEFSSTDTTTQGKECQRQQETTSRPRSDFVISRFTQKCSIGNPNINTENVVFITAEDFINMGRMTPYSRCPRHVTVKELEPTSLVLFVSHRWQSADLNRPDDDSNSQYTVVKAFLQSEDGAQVSHIWLDYSCITQDLFRPSGFETFKKQLDNIQTAIFLSDIVLVVPRIECGEKDGNANESYTDLNEINDRGWCLFEAITAIQGKCDIFVTFLVGEISRAKFLNVGGGLIPGERLSLGFVQAEGDELNSSRNYTSLVAKAVEEFGLTGQDGFLRSAKENWTAALDPAALMGQLKSCLEQGIQETRVTQEKDFFDVVEQDTSQMRMVSLSLDISDDAPYSMGRDIAGMLPAFSVDSDRAIVTNLLANVGGFCLNGFDQIRERNEEEIAQLCARESGGQHDLNLELKDLFPCDLIRILDRAKNDPTKLRWNLNFNPLGSNGANLLFQFSSKIKFTALELNYCSLGDVGAMAIAKLLKAPSCSLRSLQLYQNNIGDEGAAALVGALEINYTLKVLTLRHNCMSEEKVEAIRQAWGTRGDLRI